MKTQKVKTLKLEIINTVIIKVWIGLINVIQFQYQGVFYFKYFSALAVLLPYYVWWC